MPKCPKCGVDIQYLSYRQLGTLFFDVRLDNKALGLQYDGQDDESNDEGVFGCPECGEDLFEGYNCSEDALTFLGGGKQEKLEVKE